MAKLSIAQRRSLPKTAFVFPGRRAFPINDASHARNALARAASQSPAAEAKVRAAVHRRYPAIGQS